MIRSQLLEGVFGVSSQEEAIFERQRVHDRCAKNDDVIVSQVGILVTLMKTNTHTQTYAYKN
jgi:hypothetical protein